MTTKDLLFALINDANPRQNKLDDSEVSFDVPNTDISTPRNTRVMLTAKPGSGYKGTAYIYYNRCSVGNCGLPSRIISESAFTVENILARLNALTEIPVAIEDLDPFSIPVMKVGDILLVTLTSKSYSLGWIGSTEIALLYGLPPNVEEVADTIFNVLPRDLSVV